MKIINLMENTKGTTGCLSEHGLSFYIETHNHRLLLDTGATNGFIANAERLGVDLKKIDMVILSHGHYDHAGGIPGFVKQNPNATIFMQRYADGEYYHKNDTMEKYIGIDAQIRKLSQIKRVEGNQRLDDGLFLFSGVTGRKLWPSGNLELKIKKKDCFYQDEFCHEQYLVVEENQKRVLLSGCAHNGILNILEEYQKIYGSYPEVVISGFHMQKKSGYTEADLDVVRKTAMELKKMPVKFYTGHCTGEIPYQILKEFLGSQLEYVHSGDEIRII